MHVILLAAGVGKRLKPYTEVRPKCLMEVDGLTLLERHVAHFERNGVEGFTVVTGHLRESLAGKLDGIRPKIPYRTVENEAYRKGSILSLKRGLAGLDGDLVFMDADVLYHPDVFSKLFTTAHPSTVLIDPTATESGEEMMVGVASGRCSLIARRVSHRGPFELSGESVGFFRIGGGHVPALRKAIDETLAIEGDDVEYENALNWLFKAVPVGFERVDGLPWTEIDFEEDLRRARDEVAPKLPRLVR
jgi:choline kinase